MTTSYKFLSLKVSPIDIGNYWGSSVQTSSLDHVFSTGEKWIYSRSHQLFIDFRKAYDSVGKELLYNVFTEFVIHVRIFRFIKICLSSSVKFPLCSFKHDGVVLS